jgi:hypothetical protein
VLAVCHCRALFQRGSLDVFILRGLPDVDALTHLLIGHDGSGTHPGKMTGERKAAGSGCYSVISSAVVEAAR